MMPMAKKPSLVLAVKLGGKKPGGEPGEAKEPEGEEEGEGYNEEAGEAEQPDEGQLAAVGDLKQALKGDDDAEIYRAFKALMDLY